GELTRAARGNGHRPRRGGELRSVARDRGDDQLLAARVADQDREAAARTEEDRPEGEVRLPPVRERDRMAVDRAEAVDVVAVLDRDLNVTVRGQRRQHGLADGEDARRGGAVVARASRRAERRSLGDERRALAGVAVIAIG